MQEINKIYNSNFYHFLGNLMINKRNARIYLIKGMMGCFLYFLATKNQS